MKYLTLLMLLLTLTFSGCTKTVYVDRIKIEKVPVPCVVPKTHCSVDGLSRADKVVELYRCTQEYKQHAEVCQ